MSLKSLSREQLDSVREILEAGAGLVKRVGEGGVLETGVEAPPAGGGYRALSARLGANPGDLSKEEFRQVVLILDWMAVCRPDNRGNPWRGEALELASRLRQLFWAQYQENVYASSEPAR